MKYLNIAKTCLNNKDLPRQFYAQTALNKKKIVLGRTFFKNEVPKECFLVASVVFTTLYNKSCINTEVNIFRRNFSYLRNLRKSSGTAI